MSELKSRHAFGSEANIEAALAAGAIDAHDILFLNEGKIGWIDKEGKPIILEGKKQIIPVSSLPNTGEEGVIYVYSNQFYLWDGEQFISPNGHGLDESLVDEKIAVAKTEANEYTDKQIINAFTVVEF